MMRWVDGRPRMWYGYADFGPIQMPPVPRYIVLTDRTTGTAWWLTYNTDLTTADGYGYISITDTSPPSSQESITFGAYDGPYLSGPLGTTRQLFVRNGYLGVEERQDRGIVDAESLQIYARKAGLNISMRHIIFSTTGNFYAWVPYTITQTANP